MNESHLIMVVHAGELPPTAVTSDLDQTLADGEKDGNKDDAINTAISKINQLHFPYDVYTPQLNPFQSFKQ